MGSFLVETTGSLRKHGRAGPCLSPDKRFIVMFSFKTFHEGASLSSDKRFIKVSGASPSPDKCFIKVSRSCRAISKGGAQPPPPPPNTLQCRVACHVAPHMVMVAFGLTQLGALLCSVY